MKNILSLMILILLCSCSGVSPAEYVKWVEDEENGLRKTKTVGEYEFNIQYCPSSYLEIKRKLDKRDMSPDTEIIDGDSAFSFVFRIIRPAELADRAAFQLINEENFRLVQGGDTCRSDLVLYENNFNISPFESYSVLFDSKSHNCDFRFVYDGLALGTGPIIFSFKQKDVERLPQISN